MDESQACEVPLAEQLRSVRVNNVQVVYAFQWAADGTETGHHFVPVGHMMRRAADRIETLERERTDLASALQALLNRYVRIAESGDCGNWDVATETEVIQARAALRKCGLIGEGK